MKIEKERQMKINNNGESKRTKTNNERDNHQSRNGIDKW